MAGRPSLRPSLRTPAPLLLVQTGLHGRYAAPQLATRGLASSGPGRPTARWAQRAAVRFVDHVGRWKGASGRAGLSSASIQRGAALEDVAPSGYRPLSDPLVWSNLTLLLPVAIYVYCGAYVTGLCVGSSAVMSTLYHGTAETRHLTIDYWCATGAFLVTLTSVPGMTLPALGALSVSVAAAFACYHIAGQYKGKELEKYRVWHTCWHLLILVGQLLVAVSLLP
eukprot:EG_transcript_20820